MSASSRSFTLAHVSDWHATPPVGASLRELMGKRLYGWLSWKLRRGRVHRPEVLASLFSDLAEQAPDHVAITGDLTNVSLPSEFRAAAAMLSELGSPAEVSLVPGNHDAYVHVSAEQGWDQWAGFMVSDEAAAAQQRSGAPPRAPALSDFPTLRVRGPVALVGLSSAEPRPLLQATGRLGAAQIERLGALLAKLRELDLCRVVLVHHPVVDDGLAERRRMLDASALCGVLEAVGAELVLHGHGHRTRLRELSGPEGPIPVVGVRSSSDVGSKEHKRSNYHLFRIERCADEGSGRRFDLRLATRGYDVATGRFTDEGERAL